MGCNPCCCWKLKDAAVTIGIWSTIFCIIQLAIFGWQTAAIKYEKDRAGNTLLPNYNTYGRYDIPSYYESYWQSPEERYYIGLFVIQILCLIASFFLLFSSIMLVYGVHTWSRYLVWPWFICMASSILTSLAYCIMWWAGDVRDYWLVLTILEAFAIFLNCYCFVVICVFYKRMLIELEYYEGRRAQKYNRFNPHETPQRTEQEFIDDDLDYPKYPPDPFPQYPQYHSYPQAQSPGIQQYQQRYQPPGYQLQTLPQKYEPTGINEPSTQSVEPLNIGRETPHSTMMGAQSVPSLFDDFRDVPRQEHRKSMRHRSCHCDSHCRHKRRHRYQHGCRHRHHSSGPSNHYQHHHHQHRRKCSSKTPHRRCKHRRKGPDCSESYCSSDCSCTADYFSTESGGSSRYYQNAATLEKNKFRASARNLSPLSDANESDDEFATEKPAFERSNMRRHKSVPSDARKSQKTVEKSHFPTQKDNTSEDLNRQASDLTNTGLLGPYGGGGGISIPQHIVIPPSSLSGHTNNGSAERKYHINSEITISYDPRKRRMVAEEQADQYSPTSSLPPPRTPQPISITSNV